jgi:PAS domain-containing protein
VLSQRQLGELGSASATLLRGTYDPDRALFPFSSRLGDRGVEHTFDHPQTIRYTINTLLGIQRAAQSDGEDPLLQGSGWMVDRFLELHLEQTSNPADLGLLLLLLAEGGRDEQLLSQVVDRISATLESRSAGAFTIQELGWMLWGSSVAARLGGPKAEEVAHGVFGLVDERFVDPESLLARHNLSRQRSRVVSFGGTVYFLRSVYEYGTLSGTPRPARLFESGVRAMLELQGPRGEWPWMISVRTGIPLDFYPVFGVHQDSMAMLFLLPALDDGLVDVESAIARSLAWSLGDNELGEPMYGRDRFFAYRSIRRDQLLFRERRFARSLARALVDRPGSLTGGRGVAVNRECRSYHLGWILYAWAGRADQPGLEAR